MPKGIRVPPDICNVRGRQIDQQPDRAVHPNRILVRERSATGSRVVLWLRGSSHDPALRSSLLEESAVTRRIQVADGHVGHVPARGWSSSGWRQAWSRTRDCRGSSSRGGPRPAPCSRAARRGRGRCRSRLRVRGALPANADQPVGTSQTSPVGRGSAPTRWCERRFRPVRRLN